MRKYIALAVPLLAGLVFASSAQAISFAYCESSLRGGGTLAPDNDIKRIWEQIESSTGRNVVFSDPISSWRLVHSGDPLGEFDTWFYWQFDYAGGGSTSRYVHCYREAYRASGTYHDG